MSEFKWWRPTTWHHFSLVHFSRAVSHIVVSEIWAWQSARSGLPTSTGFWTQNFFCVCSLFSKLHNFSSAHQFTVITANPLTSCSHGNRAVKEQAEKSETWEMTDTWPHCDRDRRRECSAVWHHRKPFPPLLTSSMRSIRKEREGEVMWDAAKSQEKQEC